MVMFVTRYVRGRPKPPTWNPAMPLYVCEHRYRDDVKAFKKIKNWQSCLPEEVRKHEYTFEPFRDDAVETIPRVPSPFLRGIVGPGSIGEPLQHEEEQARYHVDGGTASADFSREANERRYHQEEAAAQAAAAQAAAAAIAAGGTGFAPPGGDPSFFFNPQGNFGGIDTPGLPDLSDLPPVEMPTPAEMAIANEAFAPLPSNIGEPTAFLCSKLSRGLIADSSVALPGVLRSSFQISLERFRRLALVHSTWRYRTNCQTTDSHARLPVLASDARQKQAGVHVDAKWDCGRLAWRCQHGVGSVPEQFWSWK